MLKIVRVLFKFVEILLLIFICLLILLPKDLTVEDYVRVSNSSSKEQDVYKIKSNHLLCRPMDGKFILPHKDAIDKTLQWESANEHNITNLQFLETISCLHNSTNKEHCFCVATTLWILFVTVILASACAFAIVVELIVVITTDEIYNGYTIAGLCSVISLIGWGFVVGLMLTFIIIK